MLTVRLMHMRRDAANSSTIVTTDLGGAFTTDFTYTSPGTYIASASFLGSPTAAGITGPGAGGVPGAYLMPCAPLAHDSALAMILSYHPIQALACVRRTAMQPLLRCTCAADVPIQGLDGAGALWA